MDSISQLQFVPRRVEEPAQQPCTNALKRYLIERGYARNTLGAYVETDLAMKEKALARLDEPKSRMRRYRPGDDLLTFLQEL